ncbi:MAG TPA: FAD-dependent monooxygenase [Anaerolineae bacterium]
MSTTRRKALIIGGGIAGPALAMFLKCAGIDSVIYEARSSAADEAGAFLALAPNGMNVLKTLGIDGRVKASGFATTGMRFYNSRGKQIGELDTSSTEQRYGAGMVVIKRGLLHKVLHEATTEQGIPMEFGKKLADVEVTPDQKVIAHFADGTPAEGDFLVGSDGLHSRTRQVILPDAPSPSYTGMVDCGGFARATAVSPSGWQHMTFGKKAFFGYFVTPPGEVYWFSNVAWPYEPARDELNAISKDVWHQRLIALHGGDPAPIPDLVRATDGGVGKWPVYDLPPLPRWHSGPVCLVGDAAHATSPHIGQGASLALEDAAVLARCLRDIPELEQAFSTYQDRRQERVEALVKEARRMGDRKIPNPIMGWFQDLMLPFFLKRGADSLDWVYSYIVEWKREEVNDEYHRNPQIA